MNKPSVGTRESVGDTFAIEPRGINWAVLNGTDLVCIVRGRSPAFEMATRLQRKATYPDLVPVPSTRSEKQGPCKNAQTRSRGNPSKVSAPTEQA